MEKQTDSVETVKSIASDLKAVEPIVSVKDLIVTGKDGRLLVDHLSLQLKRGETLGLVGESGSGKTLTLKSLIGLLPKNLSESYEEKKINGNVAMIFQNPMSALDPLCPVFAQLIEIVMIRQNVSKKEAVCRANELIERLGLPKELSKKDRLPSELSGGQCQRILIAMALACNPDVLLCDEPTTALDVTIQAQILKLIKKLQQESGTLVIFITHNLGVVAEICDSVTVMYAGKAVETASVVDIFDHPAHPYTKALLESNPRESDTEKRMKSIPGSPPLLYEEFKGCAFAPRCKYADDKCRSCVPVTENVSEGHSTACFKWREVTSQ